MLPHPEQLKKYFPEIFSAKKIKKIPDHAKANIVYYFCLNIFQKLYDPSHFQPLPPSHIPASGPSKRKNKTQTAPRFSEDLSKSDRKLRDISFS
ncbi:MAG: hypothetical protein CVV34_00750 [Methanomicrobiales archaeon HGW-Methanomicrobiales-5]|nr:MAG: hypothetical protein CVV34_00750 [Methanomicrobiales archaeon HGW-Methanomicrobiales-5]